jgi:hypothetical protein
MKLAPIHSEEWEKLGNGEVALTSGYTMKYSSHLDGGGAWMRHAFLDIIRTHGKSQYNSGFEWCAGLGLIGFEILTNNLCRRMSFSDYYDKAIYHCLNYAKEIHMEEKVSGYVTPEIGKIPNTIKWDLVVSNPPHAFEYYEDIIAGLQDGNEFQKSNTARILMDEDYQIHIEFFKNISSHLTPDADVFIYQPANLPSDVVQVGLDHGLVLKKQYPCSLLQTVLPEHFKKVQLMATMYHFTVKE